MQRQHLGEFVKAAWDEAGEWRTSSLFLPPYYGGHRCSRAYDMTFARGRFGHAAFPATTPLGLVLQRIRCSHV